ncbi:thioredoxin domain-containing protein [Bacteriovorax sp. PP10]|uniref:Thioredoxin domain-containing protein n=1 Tax=Bacteriovorax antarcticus TaxID=3088717 RepID=A0ABU5VU46_9BACT|nr:thioredoxin domain-containing protein [Bacteriovorax sp. PP10]MEA9355170.1 thioredoxin domain-containing protein [Bacteriovorax sp. PP10]
MKKDIKLVIFPLIALVIFGGLLAFFNKKDAPVEEDLALSTPQGNLLREGNYMKGSAAAKVSIVEFFDPECEGCAAFHPILQKVLAEYPKDVHLIARYMLFHGNSFPAALALEGAGKQGKYWEMYSILLERQAEWSHQDKPVNSIFEGFAKELKLDLVEFNKSYEDITFKAALAQDITDGKLLGVKGTPTFFINGKMLMNLSYNDLKSTIDKELKL